MADDATTTVDDTTTTDDSGSTRTLTQVDVDRIVQERLTREHQKFADYDDLKSKAAKLTELEAANQSELEKLLARAEAAEKSATEATERAKASNMRSVVVTAALAAGAVDPDAVFALLPGNAVTFGDDGQVTGADEAVKALLASKPYLVGKPATGSVDGGPRGNTNGPRQLSREDLVGMEPEAIDEARLSGQLNDLMGIR